MGLGRGKQVSVDGDTISKSQFVKRRLKFDAAVRNKGPQSGGRQDVRSARASVLTRQETVLVRLGARLASSARRQTQMKTLPPLRACGKFATFATTTNTHLFTVNISVRVGTWRKRWRGHYETYFKRDQMDAAQRGIFRHKGRFFCLMPCFRSPAAAAEARRPFVVGTAAAGKRGQVRPTIQPANHRRRDQAQHGIGN